MSSGKVGLPAGMSGEDFWNLIKSLDPEERVKADKEAKELLEELVDEQDFSREEIARLKAMIKRKFLKGGL